MTEGASEMLTIQQTLPTFFDRLSASNVIWMVDVRHPRSSSMGHCYSITHTHTSAAITRILKMTDNVLSECVGFNVSLDT